MVSSESPSRISAAPKALRSHLITPLLLHGRLIGSLNMGSDQTHLFTEEHVEICAEVASQLALATHLIQTRDEAIHASQAKTAFLARMSHELRTPLNAILGYTEIMLEEGSESTLTEWGTDLERVHGSAHHLLELISSLLDLSAIEAGQVELHPEPVAVPFLVQELVAWTQPHARRQGNQLNAEIDPYVQTLFTDRQKLRKVLTYLLSNACKYTHDGDITLTVQRTVDHGRQVLAFSVVDTGIGMETSQAANLFAPYSLNNASDARSSLGLHTVKQLSSLLGGDIHVTSEVGVGSTFTVLLPETLPQTLGQHQTR